MNGKKYIMTSEHFQGEVHFEYNLKGSLRGVQMVDIANMTGKIFMWIWQNLPVSLTEMKDYIKNAGNFKIVEIPEDLSFERFWEEYGNKVGKKTMTQNAWKKMSQADKIACLLYIPKLRKIKASEGTQMPYPSTYLNQKYWEV